jgi:hypothetical protein
VTGSLVRESRPRLVADQPPQAIRAVCLRGQAIYSPLRA